MSGNKRGYSMPYAVRRRYRLAVPVIWLIMAAVSIASLKPELWSIFNPESSKIISLRITTVVMFPLSIPYTAALFAQLHIVPEGIAVTLFGKTIRRIPAEDIRLLAGFRYRHKSSETNLIAVSTRSYEDLQERELRGTPELVRNAAGSWEEMWVGKYLSRRAGELFREWNLLRWLLWLDWDPERIRVLRKTYPQAQWVDLTKEKSFDAQR